MKRKRPLTFIVAIIVVTVLSVGISGYVWKEGHRPKVLEIYIFALKNGRSMFVRTPDDVRILIDGGGNSDIVREITKILPFYSRRIDTIFATNTDGKNVAGIIDVVSRYKVSNAYVSAISTQSLGLASSTDDIYETLIEKLHISNVPVYRLSANDSVDLGLGVRMNILFPISVEQASSTKFKYSKASAPELLFNIEYGRTFVSFLGNASVKIQKYISAYLATSTDQQGNVLIVSHGAEPTKMSPALLQKLKPADSIYKEKKTIHLVSDGVSVTLTGEVD